MDRRSEAERPTHIIRTPTYVGPDRRRDYAGPERRRDRLEEASPDWVEEANLSREEIEALLKD